MTIHWLIPATISLILWGCWSFLPKLSVRSMLPSHAMVFEGLGCFIIAILVFVFLGGKVEWDPRKIWIPILTGMCGIAGALTFLFAMKSGKASVVICYTAMYPLVGIILTSLVLGESLNTKEIAGLCCALLATLLFSI